MDHSDPIPIQKDGPKITRAPRRLQPLGSLVPLSRANRGILVTTPAIDVRTVCKERFHSARGIERKLDTPYSANKSVRELCADDLR
jgi:hypothetical protein